MADRCRVNSLVESEGCSPVAGSVRWDPVHSVWHGAMLAASITLAPALFSWSALAVFLVLAGASLLLGHSVGFHRRLGHVETRGDLASVELGLRQKGEDLAPGR